MEDLTRVNDAMEGLDERRAEAGPNALRAIQKTEEMFLEKQAKLVEEIETLKQEIEQAKKNEQD